MKRMLPRPLAFSTALLSIAVTFPVWSAEIRVEAVPGTPFGVGRVVIPVASYIDPELLDTHFMSIGDTEGRVLYPAIRYTQPLGMIRELLNISSDGAPSQLHMHFLFTGSEPLHLVLHAPDERKMTIQPDGRPGMYRRLMRAWWVRYKAAARKQRLEGDYSPIVATYLTSMLSQRLGLANTTLRDTYETNEALSMLLGTEKIRMVMIQEAVAGKYAREELMTLPVPPKIDWKDAHVPDVEPSDVQVEEIVHHVPHECFYIRFAQFPNYLWLRRLLEEYGGDLSRMVMLRGTDSQLNQVVESQLGLRESSLSRVLGPQVISDVALIGRDTFLREGAAIGILFEAKNEVLRTELQNQRNRRLKEMEAFDATMETVVLEGVDVSFASTPDNRLRSFYVQDGKYHLVTNCREIAKRFLQCGKGQQTLGASAEFRYARSLIPIGEENTLFVYLSRRFFEGLLSPQYQVELGRRLRSVTDQQVMELATRAAMAEGYGNEPITMSRLVELGFVGGRVDTRPDGSFTRIVDGKKFDSVRGGRGTYLPIPDVPVTAVSQSEAARFARTAESHQRTWSKLDPVLVGLRRSALDNQTERVEIQARMLPLNKEKNSIFTGVFGAPTTTRIRTPPDDILSVQAFIDGGNLAVSPHHLYFGIRDVAPKTAYSQRRFLKSLQVLRTAPAYAAAWPSPGFLDSIGLHGRPTGDGYRRMLLGLFRLDTLSGFTLLSFDKQILAEVAPLLAAEEVARPAQLSVDVGDIMNSNFGKWANDLDFQRAWETSVGNIHLLHVLTQQLRVPMSQAKEVAEQLLNARLLCPLGGEYELVSGENGFDRWASSAWVNGKQQSRSEYVSPLMTWMRGLHAAVTIEEDRVVAEGTLDIKRDKEEEGGIDLPFFQFFGGEKERPGTPVTEELPPPTPSPE